MFFQRRKQQQQRNLFRSKGGGGSGAVGAGGSWSEKQNILYRIVQVLIVLAVLALFTSNWVLFKHIKSKPKESNNNGYVSTNTNYYVGDPRIDNCVLRKYPPHRYYQLDNKVQPDFLVGDRTEYIFGEWPVILKEIDHLSKVCVSQKEWRTTIKSNQDDIIQLPFADGTNPSILSIERLKQEANNNNNRNANDNDDSSVQQLIRQYPTAMYIATACMTNTQCSWKDSEQDKQQYKISNQTIPDVILTVLLILDDQFRTVGQTQLLLERDEDWGENPRKRIKKSLTGEYHRPELDDARLFVYDNRVWLSYRQGVEFGYEAQVLSPLHYSVSSSKDHTDNVFRAWLKASETTSFCCGRNMALMQDPILMKTPDQNKLQSLTWVDPVTVIDVDTTPLILKKKQQQQQDKRGRRQRRRLLQQTMISDAEWIDKETLKSRNLELIYDNYKQEQQRQYDSFDDSLDDLRRRLGGKQQRGKPRKSHVHGTNAFMVYIPAPYDVYLGIAHFHRPHDRGANPYARHGHHYTHAFFTVSIQQPYHLVSLSPEFLLPSTVSSTDGEIIQFLSGLEVVTSPSSGNKPSKIVIAYGINDCEAAITTVSFSYVFEHFLRPVEAGKEVVDYMEKLKVQPNT